MGVFPSGQWGQTVNLLHNCFGGSNPPAPTKKRPVNAGRFFFVARRAFGILGGRRITACGVLGVRAILWINWKLEVTLVNRAELERFILENYNAEPDFPWMKYPNYEVFRHSNNQKWFALIMDVPKSKLGLQGPGTLDVVNFKCDTLLIGSLRREAGFFPAYHMNKDSWITVARDGSAPDEKIKMLLSESYNATTSKTGRKRKQ